MNGILAVAEGVGTMATVNADTQFTTALWLIYIVSCNLPLTVAWIQQLEKDQWQYFVDSLSVSNDNPQEAAGAAADYAKYTEDSASMSNETGYQNSMVQNEKSQVQAEGNCLEQVYSMEMPLNQLLQQTTGLISNFIT